MFNFLIVNLVLFFLNVHHEAKGKERQFYIDTDIRMEKNGELRRGRHLLESNDYNDLQLKQADILNLVLNYLNSEEEQMS